MIVLAIKTETELETTPFVLRVRETKPTEQPQLTSLVYDEGRQLWVGEDGTIPSISEDETVTTKPYLLVDDTD